MLGREVNSSPMFAEQLDNLISFLQINPIVAVVVGLIIAYFFFSKPKESFKLVGFCLFIVVAFYFITLLAGTVGTGVMNKDQMIYKSKKLIDE